VVSLRQFDVFPNPSPRTRAEHPYFVVLQSDRLDRFATKIVAPLIAPTKIQFLEHLLPEVLVKRKPYVIAIPDMAPFPVKLLQPAVANLESERYRILAALDLVFVGI
jgi:toxin CcdB